jgi:hypothetical protein
MRGKSIDRLDGRHERIALMRQARYLSRGGGKRSLGALGSGEHVEAVSWSYAALALRAHALAFLRTSLAVTSAWRHAVQIEPPEPPIGGKWFDNGYAA